MRDVVITYAIRSPIRRIGGVQTAAGSPFGPFALVQSIGYPALLAKLEELYAKFKLEIFKPTKTMREGNIKV